MPWLDAGCRHPFPSFDRHRRPDCTAGRPPCRRCRVAARQTATTHPPSRPQACSQPAPRRAFHRRFVRLFMNPAGVLRSAIAQQITLAFGRCHRQGCGSAYPQRSLPAGIGIRRPILADVPRPHERQPLEYGSVQVRVGIVAYPLGPGRHGSIFAPDRGVRRPCRHGRWCRTLSDVQPRHSRPTLHAEVPESTADTPFEKHGAIIDSER